MRQFIVLLFCCSLLFSCKQKQYFINPEFAGPEHKPKKVLYTQALGMSAINAIPYTHESLYDVTMIKALEDVDILGLPTTVDFDERDSLQIAELCQSRNVDGLLMVYFARTYRENERHDYHMALNKSSVVSFLYFNREGRLVSISQYDPGDPDFVTLEGNVRKGIIGATKRWNYNTFSEQDQ